MTAVEYQTQRKQRGTQEAVAALLGISRVSVARRETGDQPISREAELAILSLPKKRNIVSGVNGIKIPTETVELLAAYQDLQTFFDRR